VLVTGLEGVDDTEHLGGIAASRGGVGEDETDGLLGVDDEYGSDGESNSLSINIGRILVVQPKSRLLKGGLLGGRDVCLN